MVLSLERKKGRKKEGLFLFFSHGSLPCITLRKNGIF
jgi:hypothetical protein